MYYRVALALKSWQFQVSCQPCHWQRHEVVAKQSITPLWLLLQTHSQQVCMEVQDWPCMYLPHTCHGICSKNRREQVTGRRGKKDKNQKHCAVRLSINQFTCSVIRTHEGSQQTITTKAVNTINNRTPKDCSSDALINAGKLNMLKLAHGRRAVAKWNLQGVMYPCKAVYPT